MDGTAYLEAFRDETGDSVGPVYLWSDAEVFRFVTEGESEAAVRGKLLRDDRSGFCRIPLLTTTTDYRIDPRIFEVQRARLQWPDEDSTRFHDLTMGRLAERETERVRTGRPCELYHNAGARRVITDRLPSELGVLHLEVYRRPMFAIEDPADEPEIPEEFHEGLIHWALYRAYRKRDSQTFNEQRSDEHRQHFERIYGPPVTAQQLRNRTERRRVTTRPEQW